jgi:NAD(P)H-flavin reductase
VKPENPLLPYLATLQELIDLTPDVKLFRLELNDPDIKESFDYKPGQFVFVSAFGVGESPFGITSVAHRKDSLDVAIRCVGTVTNALHQLEPGATVGVRGPFGNYFPLDEYKGGNIFIIGGGIGFAPLRPIITTVLDYREDYGDLVIINGARSPQDLVFAPEFDTWAASPKTKLELTVDAGNDKWTGKVALIPSVVSELEISPQNAIAITCGPPIMIHFTLIELRKLGFADNQIITTLEGKMKCGLGKCARCNVGEKYVCKDGPVFSMEQISELIEQF